MAARLAASLRQSLEGELSVPKQELQSPVVECSPAVIAEDQPVYDSAGAHTYAALDAPDAPPGSHNDAAYAEEDPFSPIFSPLSSGLDRMQAGPGYEDGGSGDESSWRQSHADDLDLLQKQAGLPTASPSASAPENLNAAAAQEAGDSHPAGGLAEHISTSLHKPGTSKKHLVGHCQVMLQRQGPWAQIASQAKHLAQAHAPSQHPQLLHRVSRLLLTSAQAINVRQCWRMPPQAQMMLQPQYPLKQGQSSPADRARRFSPWHRQRCARGSQPTGEPIPAEKGVGFHDSSLSV